MLPMLPFLAGIVVGTLSVSALRRSPIKTSLHQAGDHLREAAHTSKAFTQRVWHAATQPAPQQEAPADAAQHAQDAPPMHNADPLASAPVADAPLTPATKRRKAKKSTPASDAQPNSNNSDSNTDTATS